jgi:hypothetical protein
MARSVASTVFYRSWAGINLLNAENMYVVVGQTSPWETEPVPETANPSNSAPIEPVVAIQPYLKTLAVEVSLNAYDLLDPGMRSVFTVNGIVKYFEHIPEANAYDRGATFLIATARYNLATHPSPPTDGFRSYYLCVELEPSLGHSGDEWLVPSNIESYGTLLYINNGPVIPITGGEFSCDLTCLFEMR